MKTVVKNLSLASVFCMVAIPQAALAEVSILCLYENESLDSKTVDYSLQRVSYPHNDTQLALSTTKRDSNAVLADQSEGVFRLTECQPEGKTTRQFREKMALTEEQEQ